MVPVSTAYVNEKFRHVGINLTIEMRSLHRLDVMVHVSTAYVNAPDHSGQVLKESVGCPRFDQEAFRREVAAMSMEDVAKRTPEMLVKSVQIFLVSRT